MNKKDINITLLAKIRKAILGLRDMTAEDGTSLFVDGELEVGKDIFAYDDNGEPYPAKDGEYKVDDTIIVVEGGRVAELRMPEVEVVEEPAPAEEEVVEEPAPAEEEVVEDEVDIDEMRAEIERLREENDRLRAENDELRVLLEEAQAQLELSVDPNPAGANTKEIKNDKNAFLARIHKMQ